MIYDIILKEQAEVDLFKIKFHISYVLKNPISANKTIENILSAIIKFSYFPYKYRILSENIHVYTLSNYSIYYKVENNIIYVLRILGNKQQFNYYDVLN